MNPYASESMEAGGVHPKVFQVYYYLSAALLGA